MMRYLFIAMAFLPFVLLSAQGEAALEAYKLLEKKKYQQAAQSYEAMLDKGMVSADLHANVAWAYYHMDSLGRAILHLEKAVRLQPGHKQATQNLVLMRNEQADGLPPVPVFSSKRGGNA
ncbi:MAG: hypothetical protein R2795_27150 [Saprospiraceae bacterium]